LPAVDPNDSQPRARNKLNQNGKMKNKHFMT